MEPPGTYSKKILNIFCPGAFGLELDARVPFGEIGGPPPPLPPAAPPPAPFSGACNELCGDCREASPISGPPFTKEVCLSEAIANTLAAGDLFEPLLFPPPLLGCLLAGVDRELSRSRNVPKYATIFSCLGKCFIIA